MTTRPLILITNDDGIRAKGIYHLWNALAADYDLVICAPLYEQSGMGCAITVSQPLRIERYEWPSAAEAWTITGTPADCVKMGIYKVLQRVPDLIVSGVNIGSNAGRNVLYSGTCGGVIEGAMRDIPGIAFSCLEFHRPDFTVTEPYIAKIVAHLLAEPFPKGTILNVNFPKTPPKGLRMTRQGLEYWLDDPTERKHPLVGHSYYWLGSKPAQFEEHVDSDIAWLKEGFVTAVPIHVHDLTDHEIIAQRQAKFNSL